MQHIPIRRVLISVSDKRGIIELAKKLCQAGAEILSTGGTATLLQQHDIPLIEVGEYTQFPEIMDGRVKTLHPKIHAGILGRIQQDQSILAELNIPLIDAVIVNLYPFQKTVAHPEHTLQEAIENIDIGGPTLIRAAAKNYERVAVVVDPEDYPLLIQKCEQEQIDNAFRFKLAQKAFSFTAAYDAAIANYLGCIENIEHPEKHSHFPETLHSVHYKKQELRYGENPHQQAAFYSENPYEKNFASLSQALLLQGKPLSFNNIADADGALNCLHDLDATKPACVIVKHANACGAAVRDTLTEAYQAAYATDPSSAFGGIIALNKSLRAETAQQILNNQFVEVIIAPQVEGPALDILKQKPNIRVLSCEFLSNPRAIYSQWHVKKVQGGLLVQSMDSPPGADLTKLTCVTERQPTDQELQDLYFAWKVVKNIQSNAIVYAKNLATIGIGAGQMSRIDSVRIGLEKAKNSHLSTETAVMASDAFFPFRDGIDMAVKAGITAVIQPGGSLRDKEVIDAANEAGMTMLFTGVRHFRH